MGVLLVILSSNGSKIADPSLGLFVELLSNFILHSSIKVIWSGVSVFIQQLLYEITFLFEILVHVVMGG